MISYQAEDYSSWRKDADRILEEHWKEVATFQDVRTLDVDDNQYLKIEKAGILLIITARRDGELLGYVVGFVSHNLHDKKSMTAVHDSYYVIPSIRGIFPALFRKWEAEARSKGASIFGTRQKLVNGKPVAPDKLFRILGYEKTEIVWYKHD